MDVSTIPVDPVVFALVSGSYLAMFQAVKHRIPAEAYPAVGLCLSLMLGFLWGLVVHQGVSEWSQSVITGFVAGLSTSGGFGLVRTAVEARRSGE